MSGLSIAAKRHSTFTAFLFLVDFFAFVKIFGPWLDRVNRRVDFGLREDEFDGGMRHFSLKFIMFSAACCCNMLPIGH